MKDLRQKLNDPNVFRKTSRPPSPGTKWGRDRLQFMIKRVEVMREERKASSSVQQ